MSDYIRNLYEDPTFVKIDLMREEIENRRRHAEKFEWLAIWAFLVLMISVAIVGIVRL